MKEKKAGILYLFANLFNKGISFLTVPIFTRILTTSDYGIVTTYSSWVEIFTVLISMALYMSLRVYCVEHPDKKQEFLSTIVSFTGIEGLCVLLISLLVIKDTNNSIFFLLPFVIIHGTASALIMDYQQYLMMEMRSVERTLLMSLPNLIAVISSIICITNKVFYEKYLGRIIPTLIVFLLFSLAVVVKTFCQSKPNLNKESLRYGLSLSLPLVLHGMALNILSQSDRTMITLLADSAQTGIYSLVDNFRVVATVLTLSLDGIWIPWFMKQISNKRYDSINKNAKNYIDFMTLSLICLMLIGPELLKLMAEKEYWTGIYIIPPIVLSNFFLFAYSLFINVEHYHKKTIQITTNTLIAAFINIVLNYIFIPYAGYIAAAFTTLISYIVVFLLHCKCSHILNKSVLPLRLFIRPILYLTFFSIVVYLFIDRIYLRFTTAIILFVLYLYFKRNAISNFLSIHGGKE